MEPTTNKTIDKIIEIINKYWSFNDNQVHTHTWHDKQDCIEEILKLKTDTTYNKPIPDGMTPDIMALAEHLYKHGRRFGAMKVLSDNGMSLRDAKDYCDTYF